MLTRNVFLLSSKTETCSENFDSTNQPPDISNQPNARKLFYNVKRFAKLFECQIFNFLFIDERLAD